MNDQTINMLLSYLAATGACTYLLQFLQKSAKTPWITAHTTKINAAVRLLLALGASLGLSWGWTSNADHSHVLTIAIPGAMALAKGTVHLVGQYFAQHAAGKVISINETPPLPLVSVNMDGKVETPKVEPKP